MPCLPSPGMGRYQNSGSQPAPGARRPRRGGRDGVPTWSAVWTAAATSCAVSASITMFRRSSMRRTTCPACRGASGGPIAGSVIPGLQKKRSWSGCRTRRICNAFHDDHRDGACLVRASAGDRVANRSIYNTPGTSRGISPSWRPPLTPPAPPAAQAPTVSMRSAASSTAEPLGDPPRSDTWSELAAGPHGARPRNAEPASVSSARPRRRGPPGSSRTGEGRG